MDNKDKYICYDDGVLETITAIRNMTDEEFEKYIETLKALEETEQKNKK